MGLKFPGSNFYFLFFIFLINLKEPPIPVSGFVLFARTFRLSGGPSGSRFFQKNSKIIILGKSGSKLDLVLRT